MTTTILHNKYDAGSVAFVRGNTDYPFVDWYDDDARSIWLLSGGTNEVSAFPSVVFEYAEYMDGLQYNFAGVIVERIPDSMQIVLDKKLIIDTLAQETADMVASGVLVRDPETGILSYAEPPIPDPIEVPNEEPDEGELPC